MRVFTMDYGQRKRSFRGRVRNFVLEGPATSEYRTLYETTPGSSEHKTFLPKGTPSKALKLLGQTTKKRIPSKACKLLGQSSVCHKEIASQRRSLSMEDIDGLGWSTDESDIEETSSDEDNSSDEHDSRTEDQSKNRGRGEQVIATLEAEMSISAADCHGQAQMTEEAERPATPDTGFAVPDSLGDLVTVSPEIDDQRVAKPDSPADLAAQFDEGVSITTLTREDAMSFSPTEAASLQKADSSEQQQSPLQQVQRSSRYSFDKSRRTKKASDEPVYVTQDLPEEGLILPLACEQQDQETLKVPLPSCLRNDSRSRSSGSDKRKRKLRWFPLVDVEYYMPHSYNLIRQHPCCLPLSMPEAKRIKRSSRSWSK